jgi:tetratricopeptide (TPR) repeat protein
MKHAIGIAGANRGSSMSDSKRFEPTGIPVRGSPAVALAFYIRGRELVEAGKVDSAIAEYDVALSINPMFAPALADRGVAWFRKGNLDRALADYDIALRINPHDEKTKKNRALALERKYEAEARGVTSSN